MATVGVKGLILLRF